LAVQKKICVEMQLQAFHNVPYYPLGAARIATAFRKEISGVTEGFVKFWNVRRT
jgi:peptide/nickel transport system substrate-binding protein